MTKDKIHKNDPKNMSVSRNDVRSNLRYVKILVNNGESVSIIHDWLCVQINLILQNVPRISGPRWLDLFRRRAQLKLT